MDVLERLNRRFGAWYERLLGANAPGDDELRPRDILRRILAAMEDQRREGLDGQVYVPNVYTLQIAVRSDEEGDYLRTFLDAEELAAAVRRAMEQHRYRTRGDLVFTIEEVEAASGEGRVHIRCRFDAAAGKDSGIVAVMPPLDVDDRRHAAPLVRPRALEDFAPAAKPNLPEFDDDAGTLPAGGMILGTLALLGPDGAPVRTYPLTPRGARIGRAAGAGNDANDIVLTGDALASKRHVRIVQENGRFTVYDLASTNGTQVNGEALAEGYGRALADGDTLRVGGTTLLFRATAGGAANSAPAPPPRPVAAAPPSGLRLIAGDGEAFPLASEMSVGRALTADLVLIGNGVANEHARLRCEAGEATGGARVLVEDFGTPGGTRVNGERIPAKLPVAFYVGDQVAFGDVLLRLEQNRR